MKAMDPFRVLPFQIIETTRGLVVRRGSAQILMRGTHAASILEELRKSTGETILPAGFYDLFSGVEARECKEIVEALFQRRFLIPANGNGLKPLEETNLDVFYWQFGLDAATVTGKVQEVSAMFVGVNEITLKMREALTNLGISDFPIIVDEELATVGATDGGSMAIGESIPKDPKKLPGILIAASESGNRSALLKWNKYCVTQNILFLPVYIRDMVGFVGPLVLPGETPCLRCLCMRQDTHMVDANFQRKLEDESTTDPATAAWHPAVVNITAETAGFEVVRYLSEIPSKILGSQIRIDLMAGETSTHRILKVPRCPVCSEVKLQPALKISSLEH